MSSAEFSSFQNAEDQFSLDAGGRRLTNVHWSGMLEMRCDCLAMLLQVLLLLHDIISSSTKQNRRIIHTISSPVGQSS